jgi:hypothetical protein
MLDEGDGVDDDGLSLSIACFLYFDVISMSMLIVEEIAK